MFECDTTGWKVNELPTSYYTPQEYPTTEFCMEKCLYLTFVFVFQPDIVGEERCSKLENVVQIGAQPIKMLPSRVSNR